MLGLLLVFCLVVGGVYKKGITKSDEAADPTWLSKGGDESMKTVNSIPTDTSFTRGLSEQPGLGGDNQSQDPIKTDNTNKSE
jgi:hypothetical protein